MLGNRTPLMSARLRVLVTAFVLFQCIFRRLLTKLVNWCLLCGGAGLTTSAAEYYYDNQLLSKRVPWEGHAGGA